MTPTLCVVTECAIPNQHTPTCTDTNCPGCLPGLAADTLRICNHHYQHAKRRLRELPQLDRDLGEAFVKRTTMITAYTTGTPHSIGINLDEHILEAREYMRGRLTNLTAYVVEERGAAIPELTVPALTTFLLRHAEWLSANHRSAPNWTRQIDNIHTEARRYAYRTRQTSIRLGTCPTPTEDGTPCGAVIRHEPSDYAGTDITCPQCGHTDTVDGWQATLIGGDTRLTADETAILLSTRYNRVFPPETIRAWASKGIIGRHTDTGRTVYDVAEVRAHADTIWPPVGRAS